MQRDFIRISQDFTDFAIAHFGPRSLHTFVQRGLRFSHPRSTNHKQLKNMFFDSSTNHKQLNNCFFQFLRILALTRGPHCNVKTALVVRRPSSVVLRLSSVLRPPSVAVSRLWHKSESKMSSNIVIQTVAGKKFASEKQNHRRAPRHV